MSDVSSLAWFGMTRGQLIGQLRQMASELEVPLASATEPTTYIEQWAVVRRAVPCLIGLPTSHPKLADGKPIVSSELFYLDPCNSIARTFSRWYRLGQQAQPGYWENCYPRPL